MFKETFSTKNVTPWKNTCQFAIIHHTGTKDGTIKGNINQLTVWPVSCHYIIDTNGDIYKIGKDEQILWHAWVSQWKGMKGMNNYSIGIEMIWPTDTIPTGFTQSQRDSLGKLLNKLMKDHGILLQNILRHAHIAPGRKTDIAPSFYNGSNTDTLEKDLVKFQSYIATLLTPTLMEDNTTQSKFKAIYEKERPTNYTPIFSEHDDPTPATVGDIKYLLEIANIRKK